MVSRTFRSTYCCSDTAIELMEMSKVRWSISHKIDLGTSYKPLVQSHVVLPTTTIWYLLSPKGLKTDSQPSSLFHERPNQSHSPASQDDHDIPA
jgi:hypothetical protein